MVPLSYREYAPPQDMAAWIACFWHIKSAGAQMGGFGHRVLPDGCVDLIFDLQEGHGFTPRGKIVGPMTTGIVVELRAGTELLGVRLRPGAAGAFLGIAADRLLDRSVPVCEAPAPLRIEPGQLMELPDTAARIALLVTASRNRLTAGKRFDPIVGRALATWARPTSEAGFPGVSVLARDIGLSERAFERRFVANVGLTPVRFRRLARLRAVLRLYSRGAGDWAALSAGAGFSDQSHLVREFQSFVGLTPSRWAATQAANAGFLQDGQVTAL